jgi:hypothetical protein
MLGVIIGVTGRGDSHLLHVVEAPGLVRLLFGFGKRRQQHGRQNCDDGDNHQQFDKCKSDLNPTLSLPFTSEFLVHNRCAPTLTPLNGFGKQNQRFLMLCKSVRQGGYLRVTALAAMGKIFARK